MYRVILCYLYYSKNSSLLLDTESQDGAYYVEQWGQQPLLADLSFQNFGILQSPMDYHRPNENSYYHIQHNGS